MKAANRHGDTETNLAMSAIYGKRERERAGKVAEMAQRVHVCVCHLCT